MYETTTKTERNKFVIAHLESGKSLKEVQDLLVSAGYGKIDTTRVWKIWKKSGNFAPRRAKERFCVFCLQNKAAISMYSIVNNKDGKVLAKLCEECWQAKPKQPVKQDEGENSL